MNISELKLKLEHIMTHHGGRLLDTDCQHSRDIHVYQYRIYKLDFCFNNFQIFRFSRCDKWGGGRGGVGVDVYSLTSKHSSDHYVLFCLDPLSHLAIDASSCMKLMHARTDLKLHAMI